MIYESKILNVTIRRPKVHYLPDIVYAQISDSKKTNQLLQADLLIPVSAQKLPTVIFITGGGFVSANRARSPQLRMHLAENNFVVASINYRTAPNARFPEPVEDVKSAIRFLRANAERFGVDTEKIFVIGDSAGGYLAAMAAVTSGANLFNKGDNLNMSDKISAAVSLYGVSDLTKIAEDFPEAVQKLHASAGSVESLFVNGETSFGGDDGGISAHPEAFARANPINYINKNSAPMLLMHGTADNIVSPAQSDLLFQALKNHGVEAERYLIPDANHSDEYWNQTEVFDLITEFFRRYI
ncbi:MAG: alpha/beta hydrolase [Selenomonadaceae bacterium]|nr:alpha/beta hydrolase [Selenomonadaceae bacterium]